MSIDKYDGRGGSYTLNAMGEKVLVEAPSDRFSLPLEEEPQAEVQTPTGFLPPVAKNEDETAY